VRKVFLALNHVPQMLGMLVLQSATSTFIVRDTGNCSPRMMRCTLNMVRGTGLSHLVTNKLCGDCVRLMTVLVMSFLVSNFSILTENFLYRSPAQVIY
jgi:hypothetical protein